MLHFVRAAAAAAGAAGQHPYITVDLQRACQAILSLHTNRPRRILQYHSLLHTPKSPSPPSGVFNVALQCRCNIIITKHTAEKQWSSRSMIHTVLIKPFANDLFVLLQPAPCSVRRTGNGYITKGRWSKSVKQ